MNKPLFILILFYILACCTVLEEVPCKISDIEITPGECQTDSTYNFTLDFVYSNANNENFEIFGRKNTLLGYYNLADLPLNIKDFKMSNKDYDYIRICINDNPDCCAEHEFLAPDCSGKACEIRDLSITPGDCITDGKYNLTIDFIHENAGNEYFDIYGNGNESLGYFKLADLPITIENYETSGSDYDRIKVCINDNPDCCEVSEYLAPDCSEKACKITDLVLTAGDCVTDTTYQLTIYFNHQNTNNSSFNVFARNNINIGTFNLNDLPVTLTNFKKSGLEYDFIKVAINDNPNCFKAEEIKSPNCE